VILFEPPRRQERQEILGNRQDTKFAKEDRGDKNQLSVFHSVNLGVLGALAVQKTWCSWRLGGSSVD
jgi:hypothetical protein